MTTVTSTFFFNDINNNDNYINPTYIDKELTPFLMVNTIRENIIDQYKYIFGVKPVEKNLQMMVDGFMLFNLHRNRDMLKSREALIKYINDPKISLEEKDYFKDIVLYTQKPAFFTSDEIEQIRALDKLIDNFDN
jgi:hypothetical protein